MFNIRMALEANGQVCPLHFSRLENGVAYFQLADGNVQIQRENVQRGQLEAAGDPPAAVRTLSPGAETGEEAVQTDEVGACVEPPSVPVTGDLTSPPAAIGQAIMVAEPVPQRRAKAKAPPRPRR